MTNGTIDRRTLLKLAGTGAASLVLACGAEEPREDLGDEAPSLDPARWPVLPASPFQLGVASGDPLPDGVMVWTRLHGVPLSGDQLVVWELARDPEFNEVLGRGQSFAREADGYAVKVDLRGLLPARTYYYRFRFGTYLSSVGRTRTAPGAGADRLRFAFASCQKTSEGYYTAHRHLAEEDVELVVFLGDYIYESSGTCTFAPERTQVGRAEDLESYRARYALAKQDPDLQACHAAFPWVMTWDDHETENNYGGPFRRGVEEPTAAWKARRAAAYRAFWENTPTRAPRPQDDLLFVHRRVDWGGLVSFFVLDLRQFRDRTACGGGSGFACPERDLPERSILGAQQRAWLLDGLKQTEARWPILASSVVFARLDFNGAGANFDQWDGYTADRDRVTAALAERSNALVISGDIHMPLAANLRSGDAVDAPVVAGELTCPAISSGSDEDVSRGLAPLLGALDGIAYIAGDVRGYVRVDVTPAFIVGEVRRVSTVVSKDATVRTERRFRLDHDSPGLIEEPVV